MIEPEKLIFLQLGDPSLDLMDFPDHLSRRLMPLQHLYSLSKVGGL